ncbi:MAG TPA: uroporphyrinogen decarboxylase family protein [Chthonomonadales bacterium]|nr:uroporphyrinogen decarboxylase family protein [Chthonomonadales bacterium]
MTNRERVIASLEHRQPDRTPYHIGFTQAAHERMAEYLGDLHFAATIGNCLTGLSTVSPDCWREVEPGIWQDEFGVRWNRRIDRDIGVVCNTVVAPATLADYRWPDPDEPARYAAYDAVIESSADAFVLVDLGFSLFERAWTLCGMEPLLEAMVLEPEFVHSLLDGILAYNLRVIENACSHPIDAMMFGDDWGQQSGLIMGGRLWRTFIKPRVREMYQAVRSRRRYVFIHSCGKVDELFPDLIECGLQVFSPFQPEVIDVFEAKRRFGADLSFYGGISTQRTLPYGVPDEVRAEVRQLIDVVGKGGGYIAAPAHAIPADARPDNIAAMLETLQDQ